MLQLTDEGDIETNYDSDYRCPECDTVLQSNLESREAGHFEVVWYCSSCGHTETSS